MNQNDEKFWINLKGHSMSPLLRDQDFLLIEPVAVTQVACGDILLFQDQASNELTVHRLIELPFRTKGDYSLIYEDNASECFIGLVIGFKRGDRFWAFPKSPDSFSRLFLFFSFLRMKGFVMRKIGLLGLIFFSKCFEFYNAKTKLSHTAELP